MTQPVVIVFGEMGSGKSYVAERVASLLGYHFVEGDGLLPEDMVEVVGRFGAPTEAMLDRLVDRMFDRLIVTTRHSGVVISQALYKDKHRAQLVRRLSDKGVRVQLVWVRVGLWQNLKQLWSRPKGMRWVLYWLASKPFFQRPTTAHEEYWNRREDL